MALMGYVHFHCSVNQGEVGNQFHRGDPEGLALEEELPLHQHWVE